MCRNLRAQSGPNKYLEKKKFPESSSLGLEPETLRLFPLAKVALVPVGFYTSSLSGRQAWASIEGNLSPDAYMPSYRGKIILIPIIQLFLPC